MDVHLVTHAERNKKGAERTESDFHRNQAKFA